MNITGEGQLLRVFIGETEYFEGKLLYDAIILKAREQGIAGATVVRGFEGYGASSRIHKVEALRKSEDIPVVIEIVDKAERIHSFLPIVEKMVTKGLIILEKINIIAYRHNNA